MCGNLILSARNIKKTSPGAALDEWKKAVDNKLDNDLRRLNAVERNFERIEQHEVIMLRSMKGILEHLREGNHSNNMKELGVQIDEFMLTWYSRNNSAQ